MRRSISPKALALHSPADGQVANLQDVQVVREYEVVMDVKP